MIKELFRREAFLILNARSDLKTGGLQCSPIHRLKKQFLSRARAIERSLRERGLPGRTKAEITDNRRTSKTKA